MMRIIFLLLTFLMSCSHLSFGQDSIKVFTQENLFWYLTKFHPVGKQASIQIQKGENEVRKSRGSFDPTLFSNFNQKSFNQTEYYDLFSGGLKIPTWYGVDFQAGFDQNTGTYVNPETKTPANGLVYAGVSVQVGQGLFMDKRRAAIRQAQLYQKSTFMEQEMILNDLFYEATTAYLQWVNYYNQMKLFQNAADLAIERFNVFKQSFEGGDVAAIDTLEAFITVQVREVNLNQAKLSYQNAGLELSNFIWFEDNTPLEITDKIIPPSIDQLSTQESITLDSLNSMIQGLKSKHPQLVWYDLKLKQLDIEKRWNTQQLLPTLKLKYNFLNEPIDGQVFEGFSSNNYSSGFEFNIPIFLRESRGRLNLTKLNIEETNLKFDVKWLEISNKIKSYHNELISLEQQIKLFESATANYLYLLEAEKQKFSIGESSIFLINNREAAYIQAAIKLIELNVKYQLSIAEFKQASATW